MVPDGHDDSFRGRIVRSSLPNVARSADHGYMHALRHIDEYEVTWANRSRSATTGLWSALAAAVVEGTESPLDSLPAELYEDETRGDEPGMFDYDLEEALADRVEGRHAGSDDLALVFSIDDYHRLRRQSCA